MEKNRISVLTGVNETEIHEVEKRAPGPKEVLVKVDCCALCTLEQRVYSGVRKMYPFAGGHEVAGTVEEIGEDVAFIEPGDKVAVRTLNTCGVCHYCRTGRENQCVVSYQSSAHPGYKGPGGLAEYMTIDQKSIYTVADEVDFKHAALTEPLACCIHSINRVQIYLGEDVVVMGVGIMGAFHIQLAKLRGARVIACEIDEKRKEVAREMGADIVLDSSNTEETIKEINQLTGNRGADIIFCTVPSTQVASDCLNFVGKLGRVVMYTSFHPDNPVEISPNGVHSDEMMITGAVSPRNRDFFTAARLISNGQINMNGLITCVEPMDNIDNAYKKALESSSYRVIVECDSKSKSQDSDYSSCRSEPELVAR